MDFSKHRTTLILGILLIVAPMTFATAGPDPIGLVTIDNGVEAETAERLLGEAFARTGNRFLVTADRSQQTALAREDIDFEQLLVDLSPDDVYQILLFGNPRQPEATDLEQLGEPIDLGNGLRIMALSRAAAASLSARPRLQAVPLSEHRVGFKYLPSAVTSAFANETPMDYLADLVEQDSIFAFNQRLQDFHTRYTYTDSNLAARDWIRDKFLSYGYTVKNYYQTRVWYNGYYHYNVVAIKPGTVEPDKVIVVGGHYDAVTYDQVTSPYEYAPGADDNGSGTTLTLECARVLADVPTRKTIHFIAFGAEEVGLVGSYGAARGYANAGTDVEVMFNYDMIGYNTDSYWTTNFSSGQVEAYKELDMFTTARLTDMTPVGTYLGGSSDHYPFYAEGFHIVNHIETEFNDPGWHTNLDLTSEMDFPYMTETIKGGVVSLAIIAQSPYPVTISDVIDVGDGQSLEVHWADCNTDCDHYIYWGTEPGIFTDSAHVPAAHCSYTINGLIDGTEYHVLVVDESPEGFRSVYGVEGTGTPYLYPRSPQSLSGVPSGDQLRLDLSWAANTEVDLSHYNLYRRVGSVGSFRLRQSGLTATSFVDYDVTGHVSYTYQVTAVDYDGYESQPSASVTLMPATFDGGLVVADAFSHDNSSDPEQVEQEAWLDSLLGGVGHTVVFSDDNGGPVTLGDVGAFSGLLWIDDDNVTKNIGASESTLEEFSSHNTNMLISGWSTFHNWAPTSVPSYHLLYTDFRLASYAYTAEWEFIGAFGQNGWPTVEIDPARGPNEWRDIAKLVPLAGAEVIYTFNSLHDRVGWEGEPVGLAYDGPNGKRVLLSFPLYYLTPSSAQALMAKILEYFGGAVQYDKGDLDGSGTIDITDIALILDHLFISQAPLVNPDAADMDGNPGVTLADAYYLVMYLFGGGPAPL